MSSNPPITDEQYLDHIRERCEEDFEFFVRYFFKCKRGSKYKFNSHHHKICDKLMDVFNGVITFLIINMAPRYGKTELIIKMFTVWCFVKNPSSEFIHLSYSDTLTMDNSEAIKSMIKSAEFRQLWPYITIQPNKDSKKAWETSFDGIFYATSAGGQVTGFGAGKMDEHRDGKFHFSGAILIDDPLKPDDKNHDTKREAVNARWDETIKTRRNSKYTPVIVVMQRLHEHDFCGMLLADEEFTWHRLVLKTLINEGDEETEMALWDEKHSVEDLRGMKKKNKYMFASQYQQDPSPAGGGVFDESWWRYYTVAPPKFDAIRIYVDTASKTKEHNDFTVFEVWGRYENRIYLLDLIRGKWEAPGLLRRAKQVWDKWKPRPGVKGATVTKVEDASSGTALVQTLKSETKMPVSFITRNKDKAQRAQGIMHYVESGYVYLPEGKDFVSDFVTECTKFTLNDTHDHDDQVDPMMDAIEDLLVFGSINYAGAVGG